MCAAPDDDGPRLVLADALTERADPRGEFIVLQIARANGKASNEMRRRERELRAKLKSNKSFGAPFPAAGVQGNAHDLARTARPCSVENQLIPTLLPLA